MKPKFLIVLSFDAVSSEDIEVLKEMDNFKYLLENGSLIKNVETIYPSLTYPAHTTIVTGVLPYKHGVVNNTLNKPFDTKPNWHWYTKYIKVPTLFDLAHKNGLKTASICWPVTGRGKIDYNMPEIFETKPYHNQIVMSALAGTLRYQLDLNNKFGHIRKGTKQPYLDDFITESVKYTIKEYKPNLLLAHFIDVDDNRHYYGYNSENAKEALKRHDRRLGEIINALKEADIYDESTIIALGDHSQIDGDKIIRLNSLFKDNDLLTVNKKGNLKSYKAIAKSCDGSTYVYLKNKKDIETKNKVLEILNNFKENANCIDFIIDSKDYKKYGFDENAAFIVEGSTGYYFVDEILGDTIEKIKVGDVGNVSHRIKATHGYSPSKENYGTFFLASGQGIKEGVILEKGNLINHGPTMAKLLGLNFHNVDGDIETRILKD